MSDRTESQQYIHEKLMTNMEYLYSQLADNPNLNSGQHELLAEISAIRHYIHSKPEQLYYGSHLKDMVDEFFADIVNNAVFEQRGLAVPYEMLKEYSMIETFKKFKEYENHLDIKDHIRMFAEEHENLNKCIESYLRRIDLEYGTSYCPRGVRRDASINYQQKNVNTLSSLYETKREAINGVSVQSFEDRCRTFLQRRLQDQKMDSSMEIKFQGVSEKNDEKIATVRVTSDPKTIATLKKLLKYTVFTIEDAKVRFDLKETKLKHEPVRALDMGLGL
ncbi:MAG: hypothetical protein IJT16_03280 [Lachnospiraceae bacterium]|nr:hypothetical protein [Lachnospiraceae bacterium]